MIELGEWALALWEACYGVSSNLHVQNYCLNLLRTSADAALNPQRAGGEEWNA